MALEAGDAVRLTAARGARFKHAIARARWDAMCGGEDEVLADRCAGAAGAMPADHHDDMTCQRLVGRRGATDQADGGKRRRKQCGKEGEGAADHGTSGPIPKFASLRGTFSCE